MKILPITLSFTNNKKSQKINQSTPLNPSYQSDSFSFKGLRDVTSTEMMELDNTIENEISPFMKDSKELYLSVAKIGFNAQETLKLFSQKEQELFNHKLDVKNIENNQMAKKLKPYTDRMTSYIDNIYEFSKLEESSSLPMYNTPQMRKSIEAARAVVLQENDEVLKLKPLFDLYNDVNSDLDFDLTALTLTAVDKNLSIKHGELSESLSNAQFYMFMTPYNDAVKSVMKRDEIKKVIDDKSVSAFTKLKNLQVANRIANKVVEDKEHFYKQKDNMLKFAEANKDYKKNTPNKSVIENTYKKMTEKCDELAKKQFSKLSDFYKKEYEGKKIKIDLNFIDKKLKEQKAANEAVQSLIIKIKEDYYTKQNDEVLKLMGYNQD